MGLFTTRQLLGYTEQKVKFRALFLELFFRRTVNFHTEEVMLDKITGKTPVAAYVSPVVEGKVLRHRAVFPPYGEFPYRRGDAGQNYRKNAGGGLCLPGC
ncbi:major capsid protein [Escherichia coli]|uniref:major capsid protein n=1 Tax=Escherichia coli TaxID=562 RepID=UPI001FCEB557|nr:major capsid protein [Escherichia coli]